MRMEGSCDFCGKNGDWEAGLFDKQADVKSRPEHWAALFPANVEQLPEGCNFREKSLGSHGVKTACACPRCVRTQDDGFVPPQRQKPKKEAIWGWRCLWGRSTRGNDYSARN